MFTVNDTYRVYFKHNPDEWGFLSIDTLGRGEEVETPYRGKTFCYVEDVKSGELMLEGEAYCSVSDTFDKAKGRKISLGRAIEGLDKELRTDFWDAYLAITSRV